MSRPGTEDLIQLAQDAEALSCAVTLHRLAMEGAISEAALMLGAEGELAELLGPITTHCLALDEQATSLALLATTVFKQHFDAVQRAHADGARSRDGRAWLRRRLDELEPRAEDGDSPKGGAA